MRIVPGIDFRLRLLANVLNIQSTLQFDHDQTQNSWRSWRIFTTEATEHTEALVDAEPLRGNGPARSRQTNDMEERAIVRLS
jgi:hypothetical protein